VVDLIRELDWPGVVGNTDEVLWRPEIRSELERQMPALGALLRLIFDEYTPATRGLLGEERIAWLRELAGERREGDLLLLHAGPGDLWRAPLPESSDEELVDTYGGLGAATVVYGHIHRPYVRELPGLTVANSGSVGMPFDGDWRASYLLIEEGAVEVRRVEYDVEREIANLEAGGYPDAKRLGEIRKRGEFIPPAP
jgi:diadenosine tetraphosphatase ApaH/serine/threonine PP2A family protein phosphatase